jgi:DNA-binding NarL/FixJ family response regulator
VARQADEKRSILMKVFVVDDSHLVRERIIEMISELRGVEISGEAERAKEAVASIQKLKPDVVILDIRLPGGNGIEVLKEIKKNKSAPIIIILTNYPYPQYKKKCVEAGADFFFDKSSEFHKITEVLRKLIQKSSTQGIQQTHRWKKTTRRGKKGHFHRKG